jgi:methyl-accepting chemotaxis protein
MRGLPVDMTLEPGLFYNNGCKNIANLVKWCKVKFYYIGGGKMNSLLARMVVSFSCLILAAGAVLGFTMYRSATGLVESSLGEQALGIAENAMKLIDLDEYKQLSVEGGETAYYTKLRAQLNDIRETNGLKYLYTLARTEENGEAVYIYIVDGAPPDVSEDDFSPLGAIEDNDYSGMVKAFDEGVAQTGELTSDAEYGATISAYVPLKAADGALLGVLGADFDATNIYELMEKNRKTAIYVGLSIIAAGILCVIVLARYLTRPLTKLQAQIAKVQQGDMTVDIQTKRKDEVGQLALTFQQMVLHMRTVIRSMQGNSARLNAASEEVALLARNTTEASRQISASMQVAAGGASTQVLRSADMTKAVEGVAHSMLRITESTAIVADVAQETRDESERGNLLIQQAVSEMDAVHLLAAQMLEATRHLAGRSGEIGEITNVLSAIAKQTNLLALNAAIEAQHAGEHGKGFAVVAEEVRKLATQSQQSSMQIGELIAAILEQTASLSAGMEQNAEKVDAGLHLVKDAGTAFHSIVTGLERVNEQLQEVSAASEQVSAESEEVAASVEEMERISRNAASHFEEIAANSASQIAAMDKVNGSAESLGTISEELARLSGQFKI